MFNRIKVVFLIIIVNMLSLPVSSAESLDQDHVNTKDPVQFLHFITDQVLTELKQYTDASDKHVNKVVNNLILPNIDFDEMCQWIAGRAIWNKSTDTEKSEFIKELRQLLVRTYSSTLSNYRDAKIEFQNYNGDHKAKRVQIKSVVVRHNKDNLSVDYRLVAVDDSWKVYDLIIEGVSILQGFKTQFSDDIRMHGLKSVTEKIKSHNAKL